MLKENTGRAMCDSGGTPEYDKDGKYIGSKEGYGRSFERNKNRRFIDEPECSVEFRAVYPYDRTTNTRNTDAVPELEINATINVFHYLCQKLDISKESIQLNRDLKNFSRRKDQKDSYWLSIVNDWLSYRKGKEVEDRWINTYNGECILSQTIQYREFTLNGTAYVALQIHGGADVRGGYTAPYIFELNDESLGRYNDMCITGGVAKVKGQLDIDGKEQPYNERHDWTTDDGYHWYYQGCCGMSAGRQLEKYEATENEEEKGQGKVYVEAGKGYCPFTGVELEATF